MNAVTRIWPFKAIVAVIAVLAQIVIAPFIVIGPAEPNFLAIAALAIAIALPSKASFGFSFGLGLCFDLMGGGPIGAMALTLVIVNGLLMFGVRQLGNDSLFMGYAMLFVALLVTELIYGVLLLAFGFEATFGSMLLWRVLPCTLYNCLFGLALYPLIRHFAKRFEGSGSIPTASMGVSGL